MVRAALTLTLVVVLSACGSDDGGQAGTTTEPEAATTTTVVPATETTTTTTTTEATTTTTEPEVVGEEAEVLAAYEAAWVETLAAYDPPDPDHPSIDATLTGEHRTLFRTALGGRLEAGRSLRGEFEFMPRVESIDGDRAVVIDDCSTNRGEEYDIDTGEIIGTFDNSYPVRAVLLREDGTWRMAEADAIAETCD